VSERTESIKYEPVEAGHYSCTGCVFEEDDRACLAHACDPAKFPLGHPLRRADVFGIIWIKKEQQ
jgi:hypothetical protein